MDGGKTRFLIIRHAKSEGNLEHKFQGRDDTPLSDFGRKQAQTLKDRLKNEQIDAVYFSPLVRARDTAGIAFSERGVPLRQESLLLERNFGPLDGMRLDEARSFYPNADDFYSGRISEINLEGVETIESVKKRSFDAIERLYRVHNGQNIAIVSHLFWIKSLLGRVMDISFAEARNKRVPAASLTIISASLVDNTLKFDVELIGDESHLQNIC